VNPLAAAFDAWSVLRSPRRGREALELLQERKLRRVVRHAARYAPYYRRLFDGAGVDPESIRLPQDLLRLPVTTKKDLLNAGDDAFSTFYRRDELVTHRTTGSTGEPMTMRFDPGFEQVRRLAFLRALLAAGYRPGERMLMLKPGDPGRAARWTGIQTVRFDESPPELLERIGQFRPRVLYGWVTPIRELALHARNSGARIDGLRAVITTAEALDRPARELFAAAFGADVYDIYGLTEMGTVAWECSQHAGLHLSEDIALIDRVERGGESPMIMTSLELTAMPLIRYQTGDVAMAPDAEPCACGRVFHRIPQVSGRMVDCLRLPGGRLLSPYSVTLALESIPDLVRFQVLQEQTGALLVRYESGAEAAAMHVPDAIRNALGRLVGDDTRIEVRREGSINPPAGRKFRVVESRMPVA
jgi:phenylacetate-coenzyme A ligase PaaK-like adenylate-forming protein